MEVFRDRTATGSTGIFTPYPDATTTTTVENTVNRRDNSNTQKLIHTEIHGRRSVQNNYLHYCDYFIFPLQYL